MFWNKCKPPEVVKCKHTWDKVMQQTMSGMRTEVWGGGLGNTDSPIRHEAISRSQTLIMVLACEKCGELDKITWGT